MIGRQPTLLYNVYVRSSQNMHQNIGRFVNFFTCFLSFFEHISICFDIFCNFAVKQEMFIMAKLNRIRVVLSERDLNNKWLSDNLGNDPATVSKWVTNITQPSLESLIAIACA